VRWYCVPAERGTGYQPRLDSICRRAIDRRCLLHQLPAASSRRQQRQLAELASELAACCKPSRLGTRCTVAVLPVLRPSLRGAARACVFSRTGRTRSELTGASERTLGTLCQCLVFPLYAIHAVLVCAESRSDGRRAGAEPVQSYVYDLRASLRL
jgi:hypothetical protein